MAYTSKNMDPNVVNAPVTDAGEEIVISGISGRYPSSDNVLELKENLMNKVDLVTDLYSRWKLDHAEIPKDGGQVSDLTKFDAIFFGVHYKQAHTLDPMCRILMEKAYEAVLDAGVNPRHLKGTNTGVVVGSCISEAEKTWYYEKLQANGFGITGCSRAMLANRLSYYLGLHGPSYAIDTACSSSLSAFDQGCRMIRTGLCDAVIVGGSNLCLHPYVTLQFSRLGVLSPDCRCKTFDSRANGYVRSEAIAAVFLQKAKDSKRIYAHVVYSKSNCDGYKEQGITFPRSESQRLLLSSFYEDCKVPPSKISYLEAHGTGTGVGDPEELNAIDKAILQYRDTPLKIGSIKSNIGHTEPASGVCALTKAVISLEGGVIPPNLHFKSPLKGVKCLEDGRVQVVTEPTPLDGEYIAINSFGFGGANAHVLLRSHKKEKVNKGAPADDLPRLVAVSGRTQEAIDTLLDHVESSPVDVEYVRLLQDIQEDEIPGHLYRGFVVVGSKTAEKAPREFKEYSGSKRPIWFVFSGMGSQWPGMGEPLLRFPVFAKTIARCAAVLKPHGIDLYDIITNKDKKTFDNIMNSFIGIAAIQVGLVDLLTSIGITPDNVIGHSVGELGCSYADGCFTPEQMVLSAYYRGLASNETKMIRGAMAAVGLPYEEVKDLCPPEIEVACHNGPDSSTISGPAESMKQFISKLKANRVFAKEVQCSNLAYHSRYIAEAGPKLLAYMKKVIPEPKERSAKWISTSVPRHLWHTQAAKYSSAEYHTNNLLNPVLFAEASTAIPADAICIEIAPHGLLQAILKRSLDREVINVPLTNRDHSDNVDFFLQAIGRLFNVGLQPKISNLYPPVEFPVSRGTSMISPYIRWEHSDDWFVPVYSQRQKITTSERTIELVLNDENYEYMMHHVVDGRNLVPATSYLIMVWETVSLLQGKLYDEVSVVFENIKFERATSIPVEGSIMLTIMVHRGTGRFEISEGSTTVVTGVIRVPENVEQELTPTRFLKENEDEEVLTREDIYKELRLRGYEYDGLFQAIRTAAIRGTRGHIEWMKNWAAFMDNMLQMKILGFDTRAMYVPTGIKKVVIDVKTHNETLRRVLNSNNNIPVNVYKDYDTVIAGGIEIRGMKANSIQRRRPMVDPILEEYKFVPNRDKAEVTLKEMVVMSINLALESKLHTTPKVLEVIHQERDVPLEETLMPMCIKILYGFPLIYPQFQFAASEARADKLQLPEAVDVTEPSDLPENNSVFIAIAYDVLTNKRTDVLEQLLDAVDDQGFILLREKTVTKETFTYLQACDVNVVLEKTYKNQNLLLLKKALKPPQKTEVVYTSNDEFSWVDKVKKVLKAERNRRISNQTARLVLVAEGDLDNGVLGLTKCLRREPYGDIVKTVIIQDQNAPKFSLDDPFYAQQLDIDISYNVLRPGKVWGTYRHLPYPNVKLIPVPHGYVDFKVRGDLSSLQWMEGPIQPDLHKDEIVKVVYASMNFRDVMMATGKLMPESIKRSRDATDCLIGFEFSGIDSQGRRVMGFTEFMGISNIVKPLKVNLWPVPEGWTLEDAATVPTAYYTAFYAFFYFGKLKKGEKVLIHAGSGAVGQAAIHIALAEGCEVFTTVGTEEKRKFIKERFPSINDDHIGNSRDTSFEQMVMTQTNGKGVDIVLNSLADEKLQASVRCLGYHGRFLEIGKFDFASNSQLGMDIFLKEISFYGILVDGVISGAVPGLQEEMQQLISAGMNNNLVKPLVRKCFDMDKVEDAFRYMAAGKHIGKILIKISDENTPVTTPILAYPHFNAIKEKSYILIGGLGGLGLELADWLVLRGARNLVIVSRSGLKNGYQKMRTEIWKSYGTNVLILSGVDASSTEDCEYILKQAEKLAPVDAIFNLAVLLKDCLMENQTQQTFEESMIPKAKITKKLDELSRRLCPKLRHFVGFSSMSCGRGNAGQSNYGMGNAVMERVCERRADEGLPGMAIQWGAVADVGVVAESSPDGKGVIIAGTRPQRLTSCFEELDKFLADSKPIVSSMVAGEVITRVSEAGNVLDAVLHIMNIKDAKSVSQNSSLADLGMDSMMAVEIKQTLERDFEIFMTPQDIRVLTVSKLGEMASKETKKQTKSTKKRKAKTESVTGMALLMKTLSPSILNVQHCVELPVKSENKNEVFLIPGIEGTAEVFSGLSPKLKFPTTVLQLGVNDPCESVNDMAEIFLKEVLARSQGRPDFTVVGYSYGSVIAIELVRKLEAQSLVGRLVLIDGSPEYMKVIKAQHLAALSEEEYQNKFLLDILTVTRSTTIIEGKAELKRSRSWNEKLDMVIKHTPKEAYKIYTPEDLKAVINFVFKRLSMLDKYDPTTVEPLRTPILLLVPSIPAVSMSDKAYDLGKLTYGLVQVHEIEGNHATMLDNKKIAAAINNEPLEDAESFKEELSLSVADREAGLS